jgi:surface antigen
MRHLSRSAVLTLTLLAGASFIGTDKAEARTSFGFSVGVPFGGYYGGPYGGFGSMSYFSGGRRGGGWGGRGWGGGPRWRAFYGAGYPGFYDPFYRPFGYRPYAYQSYYAPSYYAPATYSRPVARSYMGPIASLSLFPAFVGDTLTYNDRGRYYGAYQRALSAPVGEAVAWDGERAYGAVTTTRDGWAGEKYCREFHQDVTVDGRSEEVLGTACRRGNGDWQLVANQ